MPGGCRYNLEPASEDYTGNTLVVTFIIAVDTGFRRDCEVTMWEKLALTAFLQRYWADNQVSATITFDAPTEGPQIAHALQYYQYQLKGISFLPKYYSSGHQVYKQVPYQSITEEEYKKMSLELRPINYRLWTNRAKRQEGAADDPAPDTFCTNEGCL